MTHVRYSGLNQRPAPQEEQAFMQQPLNLNKNIPYIKHEIAIYLVYL